LFKIMRFLLALCESLAIRAVNARTSNRPATFTHANSTSPTADSSTMSIVRTSVTWSARTEQVARCCHVGNRAIDSDTAASLASGSIGRMGRSLSHDLHQMPFRLVITPA
jgi:hypothetical protein